MSIAKYVSAPLLILAMAGLFSAPSWAEQEGWYIQGGAGANFGVDSEINTGGVGRDADFDTGWLGTAAVGHSFGQGWRLEGEFGYRDNGFDSIGGVPASGDAHIYSLLANVIYAIPTGGRITPFLGIGAGGGHAKFNSVAPVGGSRIDDSDWGWAFQGIAGVEYAMTDRLGLSVSYRYFDMPDLNFNTAAGASVGSDYQSHAVMVALRYSLSGPAPARAAEPPPPPPPVAQAQPAPAPPPTPPQRAEAPRRYLVFFDWDSATMTGEAKAVVQTASASARQGGVTRLEVTGHADRSGPDAYNMKLSQRRAVAVRDEMVRNGVSASQISIFAKGETQPLVPTADGVREPQNRRVEIVFGP